MDSLAAYIAALRSGKVLVESHPGIKTVTVWHGTEYGIEGTARHVHSRRELGFTATIEDPELLVVNPDELSCPQRIEAERDGKTVRVSVGNVKKTRKGWDILCWVYDGTGDFTYSVPRDGLVRLT